MSVRVRFAPSPTGYLHVGGLRTALYNYLFARHNGGKMILRIEDTDRTRFVEDAQEMLVNSLKWAGVVFDEGPNIGGDCGPYIQSERTQLYLDHAQKLLENGHAYYAFDTSEELDAMRERQQKAGIAPKYDRTVMRNEYTLGEEETKRLIAENAPRCIRMKVPFTQEVKFKDIIRGEIKVVGRDIDDQILIKSDGFPTYHIANVVDDHMMGITHVIRGEEWLPSTPKHVVLYESFGWEVPQFAHLPLLLNPDKTKLSKRHGHVSVEDFKLDGFFPEALVNFVALLGWNPSADREIFSMQELIDTFSLEKVNKAGAVFDRQKLEWMNSQYLRSKNPIELAQEIAPNAKEAFNKDIPFEYIANCIELLRERIWYIKDLLTFGDYMFQKPASFDPEYISKCWKENTSELMSGLVEIYKGIVDWTHDPINSATKAYIESKGMKLKDIIHPIRLSITGKSIGAGMFETMHILGKEECIERIEEFIKKNN